MEKKLAGENLPPSYINLGFDDEPTSGPSAPTINGEAGITRADDDPTPGPSAPKIEDPEIYLKEPTAPTFDQNKEELTPPPYQQNTGPTPPPYQQNSEPNTLIYTSPTLCFEDIYEACIKYVKKNCCYSSKFVKQMKLTDINNGCAFHYTLESFGEKRESADHFTPYKGQPIDGPQNGRAPEPWSINVALPVLFKDHKTRLTIPHTDYVKVCAKCSGSGKVRCWSCSGLGRVSCGSCSGSGRRDDGRCSSCSGMGRRSCSRCGGSGRVKCSKCDGYGKIKCSKVLLVKWTNHANDFISDVRSLPNKKIQKATGDIIFLEQKEALLPIVNAPDVSVNVACARLITSHRNSFPAETIRKQRHSIRAVPFTIAKYTWDGSEGEFYIYGKEREVYFDDYPTDCCCCACC